MAEWLQIPIVRSILTGVLVAAAVDFQAFRSWQSWDDAASYGWGVAAWRWCLGGVVGCLTSFLGLPDGSL